MLSQFFRSVRHAWRGLLVAYRTELSFRIQLAAALFIAVLAVVLPLRIMERFMLFLAITGVLVLELLNSTVERLADLLKPRLHPYVADVKDMMAAAVLVASFFAVVVGILILGPYMGSFLARV